MLIIGIDPGISGSICFFEDGKIIEVIEMPVMTEGKKNKKQVPRDFVHGIIAFGDNPCRKYTENLRHHTETTKQLAKLK